jgi:hypothetical protein
MSKDYFSARGGAMPLVHVHGKICRAFTGG